MTRIGIVGENFQNDACAFKAFLTPHYEGQITFVPIGNTLNGKIFATQKVLSTIPTLVKVNKLDAVLFMCDLDNESKKRERHQWFSTIQKSVNFKSVLFIAVKELEALILADIEIFNKIYGVSIQYHKNPKFEEDPKKFLMTRTEKSKAKRQYDEPHALEIFSQLRFDIVYKKHKDEDSFQAFIDDFEEEFEITPTTKERLKQEKGKKW
jgi:Domain of unknown function (DUF4276)